MGIETIIGVALAAASAVTGFVTASAQSKAAKSAAAAQKEATEVQTASQRISDRESRRQAIREERIRRAQIIQSAESSGVASSSGELGARSSLSTSLGQATAQQRSQEQGAIGIGRANQRLVDARLQGQLAGARGAAFQSIIGGFGNLFS